MKKCNGDIRYKTLNSFYYIILVAADITKKDCLFTTRQTHPTFNTSKVIIYTSSFKLVQFEKEKKPGCVPKEKHRSKEERNSIFET